MRRQRARRTMRAGRERVAASVKEDNRMSDLVVLAFDSQDGAQRTLGEIDRLQKLQLITLDDAAVVERNADGKPKVRQAHNLVGAGAFGGAFWGMLIGLLFFMPWLGLAVGAVSGALAGKFTDIGIDDQFIKEVGDRIKPGTSALFLMVRDARGDRLQDELHKIQGATVLRTSLSKESEDRLREALGTPSREEAEKAA
jgi:uncharacterized membrane protein